MQAAGITVFAGDFHTLSTMQNYAIALGGIQIRVFPQDAPEATEWLETVFEDQPSDTNLKSALLALVVFLICSVAPPPTGVFLSRPKPSHENIIGKST